MKVVILTAHSSIELKSQIHDYLNLGFKVNGGLSMTTDANDNITYGVIMVKEGK